MGSFISKYLLQDEEEVDSTAIPRGYEQNSAYRVIMGGSTVAASAPQGQGKASIPHEFDELY